jgi:UDP-3-O-[3-hydroxymyristoyl] glucosamine N-acyltransferase
VPITLASIVEALGGTLHGSAATVIERLASLQSAGPADMSFLSHAKYVGQLQTSRAGCIIVAPSAQMAACQRGACIVTDDPYLYYARLSQWWRKKTEPAEACGVHSSAVVHHEAIIDASATVGPLCVIERGARVGRNTVLKARVTLGAGCSIGDRCLIHSGVVIGADGFGFAPDASRGGVWEKIEQLAAVRIGHDVEIGANTCIDRGAMSDTIIEDGVKLDNLIQIGHNVKIGKHTAMAGCVGVAGSANIGSYCTVGGGAIVLGHLTIADHVHISAATTVTRSIAHAGNYTGLYPMDENSTWEKNAASLKSLYKLRERVRTLEAVLENPPKASTS